MAFPLFRVPGLGIFHLDHEKLFLSFCQDLQILFFRFLIPAHGLNGIIQKICKDRCNIDLLYSVQTVLLYIKLQSGVPEIFMAEFFIQDNIQHPVLRVPGMIVLIQKMENFFFIFFCLFCLAFLIKLSQGLDMILYVMNDLSGLTIAFFQLLIMLVHQHFFLPVKPGLLFCLIALGRCNIKIYHKYIHKQKEQYIYQHQQIAVPACIVIA